MAKVYDENEDFAEFLTDFLVGKPFWLRNSVKSALNGGLLSYGVVPADNVFGQVKASLA